MGDDVRTSIVSLYNLCIQSFDRLRRLLEQPESEYSAEFPPSDLKDQEGRFRIWAGNSGAHRTGRVSLDYKLREASHVHEKVIDLLSDLNRALQEAISIVTNGNSSENESISDASSSDDDSDTSTDSGLEGVQEDLPSTTDLQYTLLDITHVITCLYKFSIALRQPAPRDRLHKYAKINVSHYQFFDVKHAEEKFRGAAPYLLDRLGRANTRRRQLLKYHQRHHDKIARYMDIPLVSDPLEVGQPTIDGPGVSVEEPSFVPLEAVDPQSFALSKPGPATLATTMNTQTTVTTVSFVPKNLDDIEAESDTGQSQTSFAMSASGDQGGNIEIPPPPNANESLDGNPFECPYCFTMIIIHSSRSWMRHVMKDLKAYICTFENCAKPDQLYEHRHEWYEHEILVHRRQWVCEDCKKTFRVEKDIQAHLQTVHHNLFTNAQIPAMVQRCERIDTSDQQCPLCPEILSPPRLRGHLARHLQQFALFVLPRNIVSEDSEAQSCKAQISTKLDEDDGSRSAESGEEDLEFLSNPSHSSGERDPDESVPSSDSEDEKADSSHNVKPEIYTSTNTSETARVQDCETGQLREALKGWDFIRLRESSDLSELGQAFEDVHAYIKTDDYINDSTTTLHLSNLLSSISAGFTSALGPQDLRTLEVEISRAELFAKTGQCNRALDTYKMAFDGFTQTLTDKPMVRHLRSTAIIRVIKAIADLRTRTNMEKWKSMLRDIIEVYERRSIRLHSDAVDMVLSTAALFDDTDERELESELGWYRASLEAFESVFSAPVSQPSGTPTAQEFTRIFEELSRSGSIMVQDTAPKSHVRVEKLRNSIIDSLNRKRATTNVTACQAWLVLQRAIGFRNAWPDFYELEVELSIFSPRNANLAAELSEGINLDISKDIITWSPANYIAAVTLFTRLGIVFERQLLFELAARFAWRRAYDIVKEIGATTEWARMAAFCGRMAEALATAHDAKAKGVAVSVLPSAAAKSTVQSIEVLEWYGAKLEFLESYGVSNSKADIRDAVKRERVRTLASLAVFYIKIGEIQTGLRCYFSAFDTKAFATGVDKYAIEIQDEQIELLRSTERYEAASQWCERAADHGTPDHPISVRYLETAGDIQAESIGDANKALDLYSLAFSRLENFHDDAETMTSITLARISKKMGIIYSKIGMSNPSWQSFDRAVDIMEECPYLGKTHDMTLELRSAIADHMKQNNRQDMEYSMRIKLAGALSKRISVRNASLLWQYVDGDGKLCGPYSGVEMSHRYFAGDLDSETIVRPVEDVDFRQIIALSPDGTGVFALASKTVTRTERARNLFTVGNSWLWSSFETFKNGENFRDCMRLESEESKIEALISQFGPEEIDGQLWFIYTEIPW